ncbi:MAG: thermonuclease family protein, partial [Thermodesulfobacteriota bacterium]
DVETIMELGKRATSFVKSRIKIGTKVKLQFDVQKQDHYGRTLAYIYLPDGAMLNELIVREGYAQVMTVPPNVKYENLFIEAQNEARKNKRGLWKYF